MVSPGRLKENIAGLSLQGEGLIHAETERSGQKSSLL